MDKGNVSRRSHGAYYEMPLSTVDASTITIDRQDAIVNLSSSGAQTRTLAIPSQAGIRCRLHGQTIGGTITLTVASAFTEDGATTFAFSEVGQHLDLVSFQTNGGVYFWRKTGDHGIGNLSLADSAVLDDLSGLTATAAELNARAAAASRIVNVTNAATYTVLAADSGKIHIMPDFTSSCTLALPALGAGLEYTFIGKAVAADAQNWIFQGAEAGTSFIGGAVHLDADAGDAGDEVVPVFPNGSSNDFHTIVTPGGGTRVYMICDGTNWIVNTVAVSVTAPTFSDT